MDHAALYAERLTTPQAAAALIPSGAKVAMALGVGQPPALLKALADRAEADEVEDPAQVGLVDARVRLLAHRRLGAEGDAQLGGGHHVEVVGPVAHGDGAVRLDAGGGRQPAQEVGLGRPVDDLAQMIGPRVGALPNSVTGLSGFGGEIYLRGVNKAVGIELVASRLGITRDEIIGVGDGHNDLEMLSLAGTAVVVEGAPAELLALADLVVAPPERAGLVWGFQELGLTGRGLQ